MKKVKCSVSAVVGKEKKNYSIELEVGNGDNKFLQGMIMNRYLKERLEEQEGVSITRIRACYIESIKETNKVAPFYGKSIFDFTEDDIQDFATEYNLIEVPARKSTSLIEIQNKVAEIFLRDIRNINIQELEIYKVNPENQESYIDFDLLRNEEYRILTTVKTDYKAKKIEEKDETKKKSLKQLISETEKKEKKATKKNAVVEDSEIEEDGAIIIG